MSESPIERCALCGRVQPLEFHHLIPRRLHTNKWFKKNHSRRAMARGIEVCRDCHSAVHQFIGHKELGRAYDSREKLLRHPQLATFVRWVRRRHSKTRYRTHRGRR